jgi:hypothetical protein
MGPPSRELTEVFCRVPSTSFSQAPGYALPVHLCRFRVRSHGGLFPGTSKPPAQSDKGERSSRSVTSSWPGSINPVPIGYASRPRLRGRLTLLRLALSRNPWTFGEGVSHPLCRYSCHHSRWRSLHPMAHARASSKASCLPCDRSRKRGQRLYHATLCYHARLATRILSFGSRLEPRYIFAAGQLV